MNKTQSFLLLLLLTLITILSQLSIQHYQFPANDHFVLSIKGIQWAHPGSFSKDYFINNAPQPHWLFDVVTYIGDKFNAMNWAYFIYFCLTIFIFSFALFYFVKKEFILFLFIPLLFVVNSPQTILGTVSPLVSWALPHSLGSVMFFLGILYALKKEYNFLFITIILTTLVHTQHGFNLSLIALLYSLCINNSKARYTLILVSMLSLSFIYFQTLKLGLHLDSGEFSRICREYIPFHCHSSSWPPKDFLLLLPITILNCIFISSNRHNSHKVYIWLGLPFLVYLICIACEYYQIPILGELAQKTNVFRWGAVWTLTAALGIISNSGMGFWKDLALKLIALCLWFNLNDISNFIYVFIIIFGLYVIHTKEIKIISKNSLALNFRKLIFINIFAIFGLLIFFPYLSDPQNQAIQELAHTLRQNIKSDSLILAPINMPWVRYASHAGVIADKKYIPYGGAPFYEWEARIHEMGGFRNNQYHFDIDNLKFLANKYKPNYLFIWASDPIQNLLPNNYIKISNLSQSLKPLGFNNFIIYEIK